jgi:hypothetical protein
MRGKLRIIRADNRNSIMADIARAPEGYEVIMREPQRTIDQNRKLWPMLQDVADAEPEGRAHDKETWRAIFMQALGHELRFVEGLSGEPLPVGFSTSALNKRQFCDLIEFIYEYGSRHGIAWTEPHPEERT